MFSWQGGRPFQPRGVFTDSCTVSRFEVISKSTEGQWCLIVDLLSPEGASVNAGVSKSLCSLSYVSIQDATSIVAIAGGLPVKGGY